MTQAAAAARFPAYDVGSKRVRVTVAQWDQRPDELVDNTAYAYFPEADAAGTNAWLLIDGIDKRIDGDVYQVDLVNSSYLVRKGADPIYVSRKDYIAMVNAGKVEIKPVPNTWSVYDSAGKLIMAGAATRYEVEEIIIGFAADGSYKVMLEPDAGSEYTDDQRLVLGILINSSKNLSGVRMLTIMEAIARADSELNNVAIPTYSDLLLFVAAIAGKNATGNGYKASPELQAAAAGLVAKAGCV